MTTVNIYKKEIVFKRNEVIFQVILDQSKTVYLYGEPCNEDKMMIIDAKLFIEYWKKSSDNTSDVAHGTPETWKQDYKYKHAEAGFSHGFKNPVPLPNPCFCYYEEYEEICYKEHIDKFLKLIPYRRRRERIVKKHEEIKHVAFTDGITRTIWLLANGATKIPIRTDNDSANLFLKYCASPNTFIIDTDKLPDFSKTAKRLLASVNNPHNSST